MLRIKKRDNLNNIQIIKIRLIAIILAILISGMFIYLLHHSPIQVYKQMLLGAFGSVYRFKSTILKTIPLVITSLGIMIAFKMKFWNIGGEGQIAVGALSASYFALNYGDLPKPLLLLIMIIAGFIGGGLWAFVPAVFKAKLDTNETIFTLMMNYIALKWITYLQYGPWRDPNSLGFPKIPNFPDNAILPKVFGVHSGWIISILLVVLIYVFMNHTKKGFEISVVGESTDTARYAGMNVNAVMIVALFLSGGLCGVAGMIQASAVEQTLSVGLSSGYGFTAIITTWLSGLSAPLIVVVSFLFAVLIQGGSYIQTAIQIPQSAAQMIQGIILFFVLGSEFFVKYRVNIINKKNEVEKDVA